MKTLAGAALCLASGADAGEHILKGKRFNSVVAAACTQPERRYSADTLHREAGCLHWPPQTEDGARCPVTAELPIMMV